MFPTQTEVVTALWGSARLARFKRDGATVFGHGPDDVWRSFFAALLIAPLYLLTLAIELPQDQAPVQGEGPSIAFELIAYAGGWLVFPVVAWYPIKAFGREDRFAHFIAAYNWSAVIQGALFFGFAIVAKGFGLDSGSFALLAFVVMFYIAVFVGFIASVTLDIKFGPAVVIVTTDLFASVMWKSFVQLLA